MLNLRAKIRRFMRGVMRWKVVFDILTFIVIGLIIASYWAPDVVRISTQLVSYWFWTLTIFVGARETGRWIGDHKSGKYIARFIAHGEIYLLIWLILPYTMGVPESFVKHTATPEQLAITALTTDTALKVSILYVTSFVSKGVSQHNKKLVSKLSSLVAIAIGGGNDEGNNEADPP